MLAVEFDDGPSNVEKNPPTKNPAASATTGTHIHRKYIVRAILAPRASIVFRSTAFLGLYSDTLFRVLQRVLVHLVQHRQIADSI